MAIRSREEIMAALSSRIGESTDDETITLLEDITDTMTDLENRANGDGVDWKARYEENDSTWRKKYTDRFYSPTPEPEPPEPPEPVKPKSFDELFTVE